ncbi:MAG: hypothetical protein J5I90_10120 [Caldilineales bacterium]|nr:hypothetical protein [Caldilineales bacterium]
MPNRPLGVTHFGLSNDVDWFRFRAQAGVEYLFSTLLTSAPVNADTDVILFLMEPPLFDEANAIAQDGKIGGGGVRTLRWTAPANGDYYLKVREASNRGDCRQYKLSFSGNSLLFLPMMLVTTP